MATLGRLSLLLLVLPLCTALQGAEIRPFIVTRVVDGDTLVLSNNERVRLIGVDTPEYHASAKLRRDAARSAKDIETIKELGLKASAFTRSLVEGRRVRLEYDEGNVASRHRDRYGRLLAYVYLEEDKQADLTEVVSSEVTRLEAFQDGFLNAILIEAGYGHAYTRYPFKYKDRFLMYEQEARQTGRGLWGE